MPHLNQRLIALLGKTNNPGFNSTDLSAAILRSFREHKISVLELYLIIVGVYPTCEKLEKINYLVEFCQDLDLEKFLESEIESSLVPTNRVSFKNPSTANIMDVTQTLTLGFTSGIQRVVREFFRHNRGEIVLGGWSTNGQLFRALNGDEVRNFLEAIPLKYYETRDEIENLILLDKNLLLFETGGYNLSIYNGYSVMKNLTKITSIVYDDIPLSAPFFSDAGTRNGFPYYLKNTLNYSNKVLCISVEQMDRIMKWEKFLFGENSKSYEVFRLYNFCQCEIKDVIKPTVPGERKILIVGSFDLRKNLLLILGLLVKIQKGLLLSVTFVGPGGSFEKILRRWCAYLTKTQKANIKIQILKNVKDEVLHDLYLDADFSVFFSFAEGFGLPVVESIHHGTPVLMTDQPSVLEAAGDKGFVAVNVNDFEAISDQFFALLFNDDYLNELKQSVLENNMRKLHWKSTADSSLLVQGL